MKDANNRITLIISTTAGDLEDDFPANQPLMALKKEAMARLKLDVSQADEFVLVLDGEVLDESKSARDLGIESGSVLTLERKEVVKI